VVEAFRRHGITYEHAKIMKNNEPTYLDRSSAYLECEPLFASGLIALLDHTVMSRELVILERRPSPTGKDRIDHPKGKHDDYANALALAAAIAARGSVGRSQVGNVMVLTRKPVPMAEAVARSSEVVKKWLDERPSEPPDPRGVDPNAPPPRQRQDNPWGRTPGVPWGVRAG
jgi:hypothetical protein